MICGQLIDSVDSIMVNYVTAQNPTNVKPMDCSGCISCPARGPLSQRLRLEIRSNCLVLVTLTSDFWRKIWCIVYSCFGNKFTSILILGVSYTGETDSVTNRQIARQDGRQDA